MANKGNAKSGNKQAQTNPATPSSTLASSQALQEATDRINLLQENLLIAKDNLKDQREKNKTLEEAIIIHAEKLEDAEVKLEDVQKILSMPSSIQQTSQVVGVEEPSNNLQESLLKGTKKATKERKKKSIESEVGLDDELLKLSQQLI